MMLFDMHILLISAISNPGINLQLSAIKQLNGNNFEEWYESFSVHMVLQNLDLALRVEKPKELTDESTTEEKSFYEKWYHSNRSCLMVMAYTMEKSIKESVSKTENGATFEMVSRYGMRGASNETFSLSMFCKRQLSTWKCSSPWP